MCTLSALLCAEFAAGPRPGWVTGRTCQPSPVGASAVRLRAASQQTVFPGAEWPSTVVDRKTKQRSRSVASDLSFLFSARGGLIGRRRLEGPQKPQHSLGGILAKTRRTFQSNFDKYSHAVQR